MSEKLDRLHWATRQRWGNYTKAMETHRALETYAREIMARLPFRWHAISVDNPTQNHTGYSNGARHVIIDEAVTIGRTHRHPGDALCTPQHRQTANWWNHTGQDTPTCKRCLELAERLSDPPVSEPH